MCLLEAIDLEDLEAEYVQYAHLARVRVRVGVRVRVRVGFRG